MHSALLRVGLRGLRGLASLACWRSAASMMAFFRPYQSDLVSRTTAHAHKRQHKTTKSRTPAHAQLSLAQLHMYN